MYSIHTVMIFILSPGYLEGSFPLFSQRRLAYVVLQVLPIYNKDGQEFVKHRAFILHVISKEDSL